MKVNITKEEFMGRFEGTTTQNLLNALQMFSGEEVEFKETKYFVLKKGMSVNGEAGCYYFQLGDGLTINKQKAYEFSKEERESKYWNKYVTTAQFGFTWEEVK